MKLTSSHYEELKASCISDAIISKYFRSLKGAEAQEYLIDDRIKSLIKAIGEVPSTYATAPIRKLNKQIEWTGQQGWHARAGGWVCDANGQMKADEPRQAVSKDKGTGEWLPAFKADGSPDIVKYETKLEGLVTGSGKSYRGSNVTLMQPEGEARKTDGGNRLVVVTEGAKKAAAAASLGYEALGLPGVDMGSYRDVDDRLKLIPALRELAEEGVIIAIANDQDKQRNKRRGVALSGLRLAFLYNASGGETGFATWSYNSGKGLDDVCAAKGADFVHRAMANLKPWKAYAASLPKGWTRKETPRTPAEREKFAQLETYYAELNTKPVADVVVNQRYLERGSLVARKSCQIIDSPVGTAKTSGYLAGAIAEHRKKYPDAWELGSTFRNILLRQIGQELGFTHWQDVEGDDYSPEAVQYILACPESLRKLSDYKIPSDSLIVIDEFMAWLQHIYTSDTMKSGSDRVICQKAIKTLFRKVYDGGGSFIALEATVTQAYVDCLKELLPEGCKMSILRNDYRHESGRDIYMYDSPNRLSELLLKKAEEGYKFIAASDSAEYIDNTLRPALKSAEDFGISARNSSDADAVAFAENPKEAIIKRGLKRVFHSPSLAAGSSIDDIGEAEALFDFGAGRFTNLSSGAAMQMLDRYRRPVPLHVHVAVRGLGSSDKDLSKLCPEGIREGWSDNLVYTLELTKAAEYLKQFEDGSLTRVLTKVLDGDHPEVEQLQKWASIFTGLARWDSLNLRENYIAKAEAQGHTIHTVVETQSEGVRETLNELKDTAIAERSEEFARLQVDPLLTPEMAYEVLSTHGHSHAEHLAAEKCLRQDEFPKADFNDAEFVASYIIRGKGKKLAQLRTEWAVRNVPQAKAIDRWHLKNKIKQAAALGTGVAASDVSLYSPEADVFARLGLAEAIDEIADAGYTSDSVAVAKVVQRAKDNKNLLYKRAKVKIDVEASNVKTFNALARKFGYEPKQVKQTGRDGNREKVYALSDFANPNRGHMLKSLSDKFTLKLEIKGETLEGTAIAASPDFGNVKLAARVAAAEAAKPVKPLTNLYASEIPGDYLAAWFQEDLISAQTLEQLLEAKAKAPEATRKRVMESWSEDGRFEALTAKATRLKALAGAA